MPNNKLDDDARSAWRIERKIPLAIIALIVIQTAAGIWSMSRLVSQVDSLKEQLGEFKNERYTKDDGKRDKELWQTMLQNVQMQGQERDRRLGLLEAYVDRQRMGMR